MTKIADIKAILFDLDGTIINPEEGIVNSVKHTADHFGYKIDADENLTHFIGPPLNYSFEKRFGVSSKKAYEMVAEFRVYYADKGINECYLYGGIFELIETLHKEKIILSLATSKPTYYADKLLVKFGLDEYFDFTSGALLNGKRTDKKEVIQFALENIPPFSKAQILMVGDREFDIIGAKHHQLKTAWAKWGFGHDDEIYPLNPDIVLSYPLDLLK